MVGFIDGLVAVAGDDLNGEGGCIEVESWGLEEGGEVRGDGLPRRHERRGCAGRDRSDLQLGREEMTTAVGAWRRQ